LLSAEWPAVVVAAALAVMILLFGGGLILGALQALGHLPGAGMAQLTTDHFTRVLTDPDFLTSLGLTFHIALTSTVIAAVASVLLALTLTRWAVHNRLVHFVLQVPLTVPHLVVAVSMLFLLAPAGLAARLAAALGLIASPGQFPLLVNDRWAVGILLVYIWKEIPFITLMVLSVLQNAGGELSERWFFPGLWPQQWGLRAWQHLLDAAGGQVASGLLQSTALAAVTAAVSLAAGVPAGRALGRSAGLGRRGPAAGALLSGRSMAGRRQHRGQLGQLHRQPRPGNDPPGGLGNAPLGRSVHRPVPFLLAVRAVDGGMAPRYRESRPWGVRALNSLPRSFRTPTVPPCGLVSGTEWPR
jgi:ABC-type spermidine/putrescine transport system permease subunit II